MTEQAERTHQELIAALEKATGPDRELDSAITTFIFPDQDWPLIRDYTASIDAAMTLVVRPMCWNGGEVNEDDQPWACITDGDGLDYAATGVSPAIALCIAALKARAATTDGD